IDVIYSGSCSIYSRWLIKTLLATLLAKAFYRFYNKICVRDIIKKAFRPAFHFFQNRLSFCEVLLFSFRGIWIIELQIGAHEFKKILQGTFKSYLFFNLLELTLNTRRFTQTYLVDLVGIKIKSGYT